MHNVHFRFDIQQLGQCKVKRSCDSGRQCVNSCDSGRQCVNSCDSINSCGRQYVNSYDC